MSVCVLIVVGEGVGKGLGGVCMDEARVPISKGVVMVTRSLFNLSGGVREPGISD